MHAFTKNKIHLIQAIGLIFAFHSKVSAQGPSEPNKEQPHATTVLPAQFTPASTDSETPAELKFIPTSSGVKIDGAATIGWVLLPLELDDNKALNLQLLGRLTVPLNKKYDLQNTVGVQRITPPKLLVQNVVNTDFVGKAKLIPKSHGISPEVTVGYHKGGQGYSNAYSYTLWDKFLAGSNQFTGHPEGVASTSVIVMIPFRKYLFTNDDDDEAPLTEEDKKSFLEAGIGLAKLGKESDITDWIQPSPMASSNPLGANVFGPMASVSLNMEGDFENRTVTGCYYNMNICYVSSLKSKEKRSKEWALKTGEANANLANVKFEVGLEIYETTNVAIFYTTTNALFSDAGIFDLNNQNPITGIGASGGFGITLRSLINRK